MFCSGERFHILLLPPFLARKAAELYQIHMYIGMI
jgi:hypothetical protein